MTYYPIAMGSGYGKKDLGSSIGFAIVYVKPLQSDLQLHPVIQVTTETPKVTCIHCAKEVSLLDLRAQNQSLECTLARYYSMIDEYLCCCCMTSSKSFTEASFVLP